MSIHSDRLIRTDPAVHFFYRWLLSKFFKLFGCSFVRPWYLSGIGTFDHVKIGKRSHFWQPTLASPLLTIQIVERSILNSGRKRSKEIWQRSSVTMSNALRYGFLTFFWSRTTWGSRTITASHLVPGKLILPDITQ